MKARPRFSAICLAVCLALLASCSLFDSTAPGEVLGLTAAAGENQAVLTWTNPADADLDHCEVWYGTGGAAATQFSGTIDPAGTTVTGLTNGVEHTFTVKTVDAAGNVSSGSSTTATPADATPPGEVTGLAASAGCTQVTLTWTNPTDADFDHCEVWYGTGGAAATQFSGTVDPAGTTVTELTNQVEYTFLVKAIDASGCTSAGASVVSTADYFWTEHVVPASGDFWTDVTMSADGSVILACMGMDVSGYIQRSTDLGATWSPLTATGLEHWRSITTSADGTRIAACGSDPGDPIYVSADSGTTWTTSSVTDYWAAITSSDDGMTLIAVGGAVSMQGFICTSSDGGATWTQRTAAGQRHWYSVGCSADGTKAFAVDYGGYLYASADSGQTWTELTAGGADDWFEIRCSADGAVLYAAACDFSDMSNITGSMYKSTDSGATWTELVSAGTTGWASLDCSADGSKIAASGGDGYIHISTDSGATWTLYLTDEYRYLIALAASDDGLKLATVEYPSQSLFTSP